MTFSLFYLVKTIAGPLGLGEVSCLTSQWGQCLRLRSSIISHACLSISLCKVAYFWSLMQMDFLQADPMNLLDKAHILKHSLEHPWSSLPPWLTSTAQCKDQTWHDVSSPQHSELCSEWQLQSVPSLQNCIEHTKNPETGGLVCSEATREFLGGRVRKITDICMVPSLWPTLSDLHDPTWDGDLTCLSQLVIFLVVKLA